MASTLQAWATPRLKNLLPLDDQSLQEIISYADTLPKQAAADHLRNLLGDGPKALEFIEGFSLRRPKAPADAAVPSASIEVPKAKPRPQKKKANIHALPPRQVKGQGDIAGAYRKSDDSDYMPKAKARQERHREELADNLALRSTPPDATQMPLITDAPGPSTASRPPPSAAGPLMEDLLAVPKKGHGSAQSSRTASPSPSKAATKTKVSISGGTAMHGQSTALNDLDSAIRELEVLTNPTLASDTDDRKRQCNCMATRHPLLDIAPNCLNCGKVICVKQGLGPCTFCGTPLLSSVEIASMVRVLKDERGEERQKANNASHKKAEVAIGKARAFTGREFLAQASQSASARASPLSSNPVTPADSEDEAQTKAQAHRDKLLGFQANNAKRTQIHDEAADYDIPSAGTNMWASPQERAQQLKKQQKVLREIEWNAKPEYETRRMIASIDLKGGKVVRKMQAIEQPQSGPDEEDDNETDYVPPPIEGDGKGVFSNNPLMGKLVRPTAREEKGKGVEREKGNTWRRVQMDEDDNEAWILDGGIYGGRVEGRILGEEAHGDGPSG
ncbi:hypothetical protein K431DRAFT_224835 [Polychaeton citri CBS 116435]|uniref:TRIP4/RQT4 C2HC5-type zinc finger domain-containing protein n=1 Tax=Polychaeton citri CBS 116435 TaxID=1314669 RepID=A0A9P4Q837_9PEZI|nr:hypothetical protein K431DRAFT_224835 [Polychaeton citri CBS 116435]